MVETEAEDEDDQNTKDLRPWVETMYPGISIHVKEYVHTKFVNAKLALQNDQLSIQDTVNFAFFNLHFAMIHGYLLFPSPSPQP